VLLEGITMIRRWLAGGTALALMTGIAAAETPQQMSSDAWVRTLQSSLNRSGASLAVDGIIGPKTRAAIKSFQRSQGLRATGDADWPTRSALNTAAGSSGGNAVGGSTPPMPPRQGAVERPSRQQGNPAR
jgi:peptidoglycan hydrolase-like protein with peptidoglycan-binding domain